jgi:hypothetical protein
MGCGAVEGCFVKIQNYSHILKNSGIFAMLIQPRYSNWNILKWTTARKCGIITEAIFDKGGGAGKMPPNTKDSIRLKIMGMLMVSLGFLSVVADLAILFIALQWRNPWLTWIALTSLPGIPTFLLIFLIYWDLARNRKKH